MYTIVFDDYTTFSGGSIEDSKWNTMPNKKIQSIAYKLHQSKVVVISGFSRYNQLVERVRFVNKAGEKITKFIIMATHNDITYQLIVDFQTNKIYQKKTEKDKEYLNRSVTGWKDGVFDSCNPYFKLED